MNDSLEVNLRVGSDTSQHRLVRTESSTLAGGLAGIGFPLNTRCGGRGLCRGCRVEIDGKSIRACQTPSEQLEPGIHEIFIPDASLHDEKLDGISVFEIGLADPPFRRRDGLGLALDVGTTTVAAALWDLRSGCCLAEGAITNDQRRFGDNVLARIEFAGSARGVTSLQQALIHRSIHPLLRKLLAEAGREPTEISEAVASGNTVMLHTLAGQTLDGFAAYPFSPVFLDGRILPSGQIGFETDFPLQLVPGLGAFVGGDITAGALASGMVRSTGPALLIDFGTNGEILLKTRDGYLSAATAAGPAFEGGRLNCGRPAAPGVIGALACEDGKWRASRIGGADVRPVPGLSGSAYVDFMAQAIPTGLINPMGRFQSKHPQVGTRILDDEETPVVEVGEDVFVTESDVAELMQAKAAILGGVHTLLEEAEIEVSDLETVYVAGGFGYHLNPTHAVNIGLLPDVPFERFRIIGNSSLAGASLLLQADLSETLQTLLANCRAIELNQIDSFEDHFIDAMPLQNQTPPNI